MLCRIGRKQNAKMREKMVFISFQRFSVTVNNNEHCYKFEIKFLDSMNIILEWKYHDLMYTMLLDFIKIFSNTKLLSIEISILSFVSATKRNQWKNIYKKNVKRRASIYESHSMIKLRSIWLNTRKDGIDL